MALPVAAAAATAPVQVADVLIPGSVLVFPLFEKGTVTNAGFFQNLAWSTTRSLWASTSTTRLTSLSSADGPRPALVTHVTHDKLCHIQILTVRCIVKLLITKEVLVLRTL